MCILVVIFVARVIVLIPSHRTTNTKLMDCISIMMHVME